MIGRTEYAPDYDSKSAKADPFSHIQHVDVAKLAAKRRSVNLASDAQIRVAARGVEQALRQLNNERQKAVAERIAVNLKHHQLSLDDFIDLGWEFGATIYSAKNSWSRAVRVVMGVYPDYESDSARDNAIVPGLTAMESTCDALRDAGQELVP